MDFSEDMFRANPGVGRSRFSRIELRDIAISILVLALAFTLVYASRNNRFVMTAFENVFGTGAGAYIGLFLACIGLVVVSFFLHEMGHKFAAQRRRLWSEYRMFPAGLGLTLILSFAGFLFAAPGAVMIAGPMDSETNGRISIAGPAVNLVFSAIGIAGCYLFNGDILVVPFYLLATLNASLALFNLIPIPPLDGSKILKWNVVIWIIAIALAAVEFILLARSSFYYFI
ncbi:MAG: M50 family metallopeptidase [Candidatus Methanomethylophilaceae archaeon]|jgi:Zn-dependent protease|nr:M50 family metallopeptidase [Candidatus Methanomethylophilaceae archaeon]